MTMIIEMPNSEYFRSTQKLGLDKSARIDKENRVIHGVTLIQLGRINDDREVRADETSLLQVETMVNEKGGGMKSRFGHPNTSDDGSPRKFLGSIKDARIEGDKTLGDLHLSDTAFKNTNYGQQVLDMAENDPDKFGMSLAPRWDHDAMKKTKKTIDGEETEALRFKSLGAIDVVDDPAATRDGMFSSAKASDLPEVATQMLNYFFPEASPEVIEARVGDFLSRYNRNRFGDPDMNKSQLAETKTALEELQGQYKSLSEKIAAGEKSEELKTELEAVTGGLKTLNETLEALKAGDDSAGSDVPNRQATDEAATSLAASKRSSEILLACKQAGCMDLASDFMLDQTLSVDDVRKKVLDHVSKTNGSLGTDQTNPDKKDKKDPVEEKLSAEYDDHAEEYENLELSKEDFIRSRKIDMGLLKLQIGKKPTPKEKVPA